MKLLFGIGYGLGALALAAGLLPRDMPPALAVAGRPPLWLGVWLAAFLLPTTLLVTDRMLRRIAVRPPADDPESSPSLSIYDAIMLRIGVFVTGMHVLTL